MCGAYVATSWVAKSLLVKSPILGGQIGTFRTPFFVFGSDTPNSMGNKTNAREARIQKEMTAEFNRLVRYMVKTLPGYKPPSQYKPTKLATKFRGVQVSGTKKGSEKSQISP